ncbi:MAG: hypothetical protein JW809_15570 [Pirellulales bacterium]|nr:hypothetical protein [Pirellulales bacterium]
MVVLGVGRVGFTVGAGPAVTVHGAAGFRVDGGPGDDVLTVDLTAGPPPGTIVFDGGDGDDRLVLHNCGGFNTATTTFTGPDAGTIQLDVAATIEYASLTPVDMTGSIANHLVFNLPSDGVTDDDAVLEDDGAPANNTSRIRSQNGTFETTTFTNPTGSVTVNMGAAGDTFTLASLDPAFDATVTVLGQNGADTVLLQAATGTKTYAILGGPGDDRLTGPAGNQTWNVTSSDAGNLGGAGVIDFAGIENLTGQGGDDRFVLADGAGVSGRIDGGAGSDTLDYAAYTTPIAVTLPAAGAGAATHLGGHENVENLTGGQAGDTIAVAPLAVARAILGGPGDDRLGFDALGTRVTFSATQITANGYGSVDFAGLEEINVSNTTGQATLAGGAGPDVLAITAVDDDTLVYVLNASFPTVNLDGLDSFAFQGGAGDDQTTVDVATGTLLAADVSIDGQTDTGAPGDRLAVRGGGAGVVTYTPDGVTSGKGSLVIDGRSLKFAGLEPIDIADVAHVTVTMPNVDDQVTLADGTGFLTAAQALRLSGQSGGVPFETAAIWNVQTLVVDTSPNGNDAVTIAAAAGAHNVTNLTVRAGGGGGTVQIAGPVTLLGNLVVDSGGSVNGDGLVTAATVDLNAALGIGNAVGLRLATSLFEADTLAGNVALHNQPTGPATATSLTTGLGSINFEQAGNHLLTLPLVDTDNGSIQIVAGGTIRADSLDASGTDNGANAIAVSSATGDVVVGLVNAGSLNGVTLVAGGAVVDGDAATDDDVLAGSLAMTAALGIGAAGDPATLETTVAALAANAGAGGLYLANTGPLAIDLVGTVDGVAAAGPIDVRNSAAMTVRRGVHGQADVTLTAGSTLAPGDDLVVQGGGAVTTTGGDVVLQAGDEVALDAGSTANASGRITLNLGYQDADGIGSGRIAGTLASPVTVEVNGGTADDTLTIFHETAVLPATGLVFDGGAGSNTLTIEGSDAQDVVTVGEATRQVAVEGHGLVTYDNIDRLNINGNGGDERITFEMAPAGTLDVYVDGGGDTFTGGAYNDLYDAFKIKGTPGSDVIVVVEGSLGGPGPERFSVEGLESLQVFGENGDDAIWNNTTVPSLLVGGNGNDVIHGGNASGNAGPSGPSLGDVIFGGDGIDQLFGEAGNEFLFLDHDYAPGYPPLQLPPPAPQPVSTHVQSGDEAQGGNGSDTIVALGTDTVNGGGATNTIIGSGLHISIVDWLFARFLEPTPATIDAALAAALLRPWTFFVVPAA